MNPALTLPPEPGRVPAAMLAGLTHVLFFALITAGITWQVQDPEPVMVELFQPVPEPPPPQPLPPEPVVEKAPPPEPPADIGLERKRREEAARRRLEIEERKRQDRREAKLALEMEQRRLHEIQERKRQDQRETLLALEMEQRRLREERAREERRHMEQELLREMEHKLEDDDLARELAAARQLGEAAQRSREVAKLVVEWQDRIKVKIRGYVNIPPGVQNNPEVKFLVTVLPTGDVAEVKKIKASGSLPWDEAVERAIFRASPLPLPADRGAAAQFRELRLVFTPKQRG